MEKRFRVYHTTISYGENQLLRQSLIVLQHEDGMLQFTNWHRFCQSSANRIKRVTQSDGTRHKFVVKFLNYAFFTRGVGCLNEISADIVSDFLNAYGRRKLPDDGETAQRAEATVRKCVASIIDFVTLLILDQGDR